MSFFLFYPNEKSLLWAEQETEEKEERTDREGSEQKKVIKEKNKEQWNDGELTSQE